MKLKKYLSYVIMVILSLCLCACGTSNYLLENDFTSSLTVSDIENVKVDDLYTTGEATVYVKIDPVIDSTDIKELDSISCTLDLGDTDYWTFSDGKSEQKIELTEGLDYKYIAKVTIYGKCFGVYEGALKLDKDSIKVSYRVNGKKK